MKRCRSQQTFAYLLPFTRTINPMGRIMISSGTLTAVAVDILVIISFGIIMQLISILAFNRAIMQ
jgi:hypothetical protein